MAIRRSTRIASTTVQRRFSCGFGDADYQKAFGNIPGTPDKAPYKTAVLEYLDNFDANTWTTDPVQSMINGKVVGQGNTVDTIDAFAAKNGKMVHGDAETIAALKNHLHNVETPVKDYRKAAREIEDKFIGVEYATPLIGNQAMDFKKQDGFTEIEEWVQAATVERRLNDTLLAKEAADEVRIGRNIAFVGCVSNFSNFLDLSRKVLRNIELGVPVCVLSRSNTTQHMYRWFQILSTLMKEHGIPQSMATYASLDVQGQRDLIASCENSSMYFTGSRQVAEALKEVCPNLMSATVGPNTLVATELTKENKDAIRISSTIENAGQCTHVRHLVAPSVSESDVQEIYDGTNVVDSITDAIKNDFRPDGMLAGHPTTATSEPSYTAHPSGIAAYKIRDSEFPPDQMDEKWRQAFLDVTSVKSADTLKEKGFLDNLGRWLVRNGPITLAVNGSNDIAKELFERSSMTTYTIGDNDAPALTVSARPQEGEAFGEFPARSTLTRFTKFPVLVPSSTPSYHTEYTPKFLESMAQEKVSEGAGRKLQEAATSDATKGYLSVLKNFMSEAAGVRSNTNHRHARTAIAGWQRPPLTDAKSWVRVEKDTSVDAAIVACFPYVVTNAAECLAVSVHPENKEVIKALGDLVTSTEESFETPVDCYNVTKPSYDGVPCAGGAPLAGAFLALHFPVGHVKCLIKDNQEFINKFSDSRKWLTVSA